jgi:hypothetical protein
MADLKNVTIDDNGFIKLPSGNRSSQRPSSPPTGTMRFNNEYSTPEVYTTTTWTPTVEATEGLIADYDSLQYQSDTNSINNLLPVENWRIGNGGETGFGANGAAAENRRIWSQDPWGNTAVCWDTPSNDSAQNADGGWNSQNVSIDYFQFHRHTVWIKRPSGGNGSTYLGLRSNDGVDTRTSGGRTTNPYFYSGGWPGSNDTWYLFVGHTWPYKSGTGSDHPESGIYDINGNKIAGMRDYVYRDGASYTMHRTYLFYSSDTTTSHRWHEPRIDVIDGTEPSITDLLTNAHNVWRDSAGGGNDLTPINYPAYDYTEEAVRLDGNNEYFRTKFDREKIGSNFSISLVYRFTGTTGDTYRALLGNQAGDFFVGKDTGNTNIGIQDGNYISNVATGTNAWDGNYHHLVWTCNGNTDTIYLDGTEVGSATFTGANATSPIYIGAESTQYFMHGFLKQVRFFDKTLTAAEIQKNYEAVKHRYNI